MTPTQFIRKWSASTLKESAASQSHFNDICRLLGEPTPVEADPEGKWYTFEKGARKTGGGDGWADVWKHRFFAWEYKGKHKDLDAAFAQLQRYAIALENPPMLVVSDMDIIEIHTNYTNTVEEVHKFGLEDLASEDNCKLLKLVFTDPEQLKPGVTREKLTERAAEAFAGLARRLHQRGHEPQRVAHFINKLVFCMFAEDIGILPARLLTNILERAALRPERFLEMAHALFVAMRAGGSFGSDFIDWFNGGLFDDEEVLPLQPRDISEALAASRLDWSAIEPSIFGTLFERGLDPSRRSQLGAHYTDPQSIMRIVNPVVIAPIKAEWERVRTDVRDLLEKSNKARGRQTATRFYRIAKQRYLDFKADLVHFRVLDAACGSGNFLYLSLLGLKDLELQVMLEGEAEFGMEQWFPMVDPHNVLGIEVNPYAAELARLTIWIGQIQWMLRHGFQVSSNPILKNLDQIACRDALLNERQEEADWPQADCIIGNPPFLGDKKMISELSEEYTSTLRRTYGGTVPGGADLVIYWFNKAWREIKAGKARRVGLVATNSIRGGYNRKALDIITASGGIFNAWSDESWILDGAAVRVSIVCFAAKNELADLPVMLNGEAVTEIFPDLTARTVGGATVDLTKAQKLRENAHTSFQGPVKVGGFNVPGDVARKWLALPANVNGRPNADVVKPWSNGMDLTRRASDTWIIDFGVDTSEDVASHYEAPFQYVLENVKPQRDKNRDKGRKEKWWLLGRSGEDMRNALKPLVRYILTPRVSKHRLFVWMNNRVLPDSAVVAIARDDDTSFGILHSRFHELWSLRMGTSLEDRPRYTPSSTFETFPFPSGLTPDIPATQYASEHHAATIAEAARKLNDLRQNWLNPPELIRSMPEVGSGFPDRVVPMNKKAADQLRKRTLTNLYNQKPAWLVKAHQNLDEAVANAYGWSNEISDDEALARLLELNGERSMGRQASEIITRKGPSREQGTDTARTVGLKR